MVPRASRGFYIEKVEVESCLEGVEKGVGWLCFEFFFPFDLILTDFTRFCFILALFLGFGFFRVLTIPVNL